MAHAQLASLAENLLKRYFDGQYALGTAPAQGAPALRLGFAGRDLRAELQYEGCAEETIKTLVRVYDHAKSRMSHECQQAYRAHVDKLGCLFQVGDMQERYRTACAAAFERCFDEALARLEGRLLDEVRAAQSRHATQAAAPPSDEPGQFTPDVLRVLHAAFDASDSVSRAERRELAGATGLTERQILTWFANQRQRRSKKRAAPYDVQHRRAPLTPASQRSSRQHPEQQRTVSASTSSSSLVEYDDAPVDIPVSSSPPRAPIAHPPPTFEWQLPVPPSLAQYTQQQQQPLVLPSLQLSAPTPIAASFAPPAPAPAPAPAYNPFESSSPGGWSPSSSTSSLSFGAPSATAAPSMDFFAPGSSLSSSPPSSLRTNPFLAPLAPVEVPSVVSVPGMGDAWMDETFYENLFASLGLDGSSAGLAAPQQLDFSRAGLDFGGMIGADGDGLTLSLEAVRAEEGMGGEMRFAF